MTVDQALKAREWERDREAWNLPRGPRELGVASTDLPTDEVATAADAHLAADGVIQAED